MQQTITTKQYNRWLKLASVVAEGNNYYAEEILQELMVKIVLKLQSQPSFEITENYIFSSLKNRYINMMRKEINTSKMKCFYKDSTSNIIKINGEMINNQEEYTYDIENDLTTDKKKQVMENIALKLNYFDKQLYILHFIKGVSQRQISRESELTLAIIHERIKKIKNKIKEEYGTE
tara:strand:- start:406 stop:936 length:531 start_codon:yes stop_codon:yes gene_type:complete